MAIQNAPNPNSQLAYNEPLDRLLKENLISLIDDGTPLLDIKPYVPEMEAPKNYKIGWLTQYQSMIRKQKSDKRFSDKK